MPATGLGRNLDFGAMDLEAMTGTPSQARGLKNQGDMNDKVRLSVINHRRANRTESVLYAPAWSTWS